MNAEVGMRNAEMERQSNRIFYSAFRIPTSEFLTFYTIAFETFSNILDA